MAPALGLLSAAVLAWVAYLGVRGCGYNGRFCPAACERLEAHVNTKIVGQELALTQLRDVVCDHVANPRPRKPLVVSLHGPPGVGKTFYHKLLAESLYNMTGLAGRAPSCDPGGQDCPGYRVIFGTDYLAAERDQQASRLRASVLGHLQKYPESVLVIEEYDKVDCQSRSMLRQLLDKGISGNVSAARSIVVLEANTGSSHMYKLLQKAGSRERLSPELAHRSLKDVLYNLWMADRCGEAIETQKMLSLIDAFVPLLPLERRHIRTVMQAHLQERRLAGVVQGEFQDLSWDAQVLEALTDKVEFEGGETQYAIEGAKEAPVVLSRHVSRALRNWRNQRAARLVDSCEQSGLPALRLRLSSLGTVVAVELAGSD